VRYQTIENPFHITRNVRIGVLIDGDTGRRMRHVYTAHALFDPGLSDHVLDIAGDVHELRALAGFDAKRLHAKCDFTESE
jgi:hypothetical protein